MHVTGGKPVSAGTTAQHSVVWYLLRCGQAAFVNVVGAVGSRTISPDESLLTTGIESGAVVARLLICMTGIACMWLPMFDIDNPIAQADRRALLAHRSLAQSRGPRSCKVQVGAASPPSKLLDVQMHS